MIGYGLLLVFFLMKLIIGITKTLIRVPVEFVGGENLDKRTWPSLTFNLITIFVGLLVFYLMLRKSMVLALLLPFSFRSGANFGRFLVYSIHDAKILKEEKGIFGVVSLTLLLLELSFLLALIVISQSLYVALNGVSLSLLLWFSGLTFGCGFGLIVANTSRGLLMRDSIALLTFLGAKKIKKINLLSRF